MMAVVFIAARPSLGLEVVTCFGATVRLPLHLKAYVIPTPTNVDFLDDRSVQRNNLLYEGNCYITRMTTDTVPKKVVAYKAIERRLRDV